jgi:UDP-sugar transporter A1/2/3
MVTAEQLKLPCILAGVVLMTSQPIFVKLSQVEGPDGKPQTEYNKFSSVLLTELGKALFSLAALVYGGGFREVHWCGLEFFREALQYAVPELIYCINNFLVLVILEYVDMTTFQLLGQLKIVFTGLLFRVVLRRRLSDYQWLAIWQLACGATVSQIPTSEPQKTNAPFFGVVLSVISCCLSALAGIYNEKIMKDKASVSIHWQNLQLYTWGIVFCLVGDRVNTILRYYYPELFPDQAQPQGFLSGYNVWAVIVVLNNMFMGLSISAILKFVDNIARVYTHTMAMLTTSVLAVVLFHEKAVSLQMCLGIAIVSSSAVQYNLTISDVKSRLEEAQQLDLMDNGGGATSDEESSSSVHLIDNDEPSTDVPLKRA